ncbi:aromatic acid exporter family protein [Neobacillus mesonae]|uniref:FUSC family protein n=1 Tax=Neobacillus mesonae TaxID=1193713 RepID=UPI00203C5C58|nr:FUSC family protein [Neobacillus mesonae]MCM3571074.1 aromatic acid exporter family protein [Neobacillus mesonae]
MKNNVPGDNISILIWNMSIGSTLSWELAKIMGSSHPYLAPLSVILSLQSTDEKTISLSIKRLIGTIIGIFVTVLIASNMKINGWNLGILIFLGGYAEKYLKLDRKVLHQTALTILFVFAFEHQTKHYALDRLRDTLIGVSIACIIQLVWFRIIFRKP